MKAWDFCCGKGGWTRGLQAAGWSVAGFDIQQQPEYPGEFFWADLRAATLADLIAMAGIPDFIVASLPCEEFSRHTMPWTRKRNPPPPDPSIWLACVRLAKEAGVPLVLENVREAQKWMGRAAWHFGPFYLWGDVPALMPAAGKLKAKESLSSTRRLERAMIPIELSRHVGRVFAEELAHTSCDFCGYGFDATCGRYGCPNCNGEGLCA